MKKQMNMLFAAVIAVAATLVAKADEFKWLRTCDTYGRGAIDWTETGAAQWQNVTTGQTGALPGPTDTVVFTPLSYNDGWSKYAGRYHDFIVTPPADFKGTIKVLRTTDTLIDIRTEIRPHLKIVNTNGATGFTVGGNGIIQVFEGFEDAIAADFAGDIEIPQGVTFAPSASFPATSATFVGAGVFKPTTVAQLAQAARFRGDLDLTAIGSLNLGGDYSVLMGRNVAFGPNVSFDNSKAHRMVKRLDMSNAANWTLNGVFSTTKPATVPSFDAAGTLTIPNGGAADTFNKTSAFFNQRFKRADDFAMKFKLTVARNTGISGFGIVLHAGELTDVATKSDGQTTGSGALPGACWGVGGIFYNNYGGALNAFENLAGNTFWRDWSNQQSFQDGAQAEMSLSDGKPFDVTLGCSGGLLVMTFSKGGTSRTFEMPVTELFANDSRGLAIGFVTHESDNTQGSGGKIALTISELEGWLYSDDNGQWVEWLEDEGKSYYTFGPDNYNLYLDYKDNASSGISSFRGADALDANGRIQICNGMAWFGAAVSKYNLNAYKERKFRLGWTLDVGESSNNGRTTSIGFTKLTTAEIKSKYGDPAAADGSGFGLTDRMYPNYSNDGKPIKFVYYWNTGRVGLMKSNDEAGFEGGGGTHEKLQGVIDASGSSNTAVWYYDGAGTSDVELYAGKDGSTYHFTLPSAPISLRKLVISGCGANDFNWPCYTRNWMRDITVTVWNDNYAPEAYLRLAAPAGASTIPGAGTYAPVEGLALKDATSRVKFSGTVAFGPTLKITVPDDYLKSLREKARIVDFSSATVSGSLPTAVTLVDSTGAAIPMRGRTLTVDADGIGVSAPRGLFIVIE